MGFLTPYFDQPIMKRLPVLSTGYRWEFTVAGHWMIGDPTLIILLKKRKWKFFWSTVVARECLPLTEAGIIRTAEDLLSDWNHL